MINKDNLKCCEFGTYSCTVSMPIANRVEEVDYCIARIVAALNAANIKTLASCCGHGIKEGSIILEDGMELVMTKQKKRL
jgi:hypothetical protein